MNKPLIIALIATCMLVGVLYFVWQPSDTPNAPQENSSDVVVPENTTPVEEEEALPPPPVSGNITVTFPLANATVGAQLVVQGQARVFESTVNYRLTDSNNTVLASGFATAQAPDIGQFGPYAITTSYLAPGTSTGTLEVFAVSAQDGSEIDMVTVPVTF